MHPSLEKEWWPRTVPDRASNHLDRCGSLAGSWRLTCEARYCIVCSSRLLNNLCVVFNLPSGFVELSPCYRV